MPGVEKEVISQLLRQVVQTYADARIKELKQSQKSQPITKKKHQRNQLDKK